MNKLIYFSANWCGPCKMVGPTLEKVSQQGIPVQKIDVDQNPELVSKYGVRNIPTILKVDSNGVILGTLIGVNSEDTIKNFYNG